LASGTNKQKADYYRNKGQALSHLGQYQQASKFFDRSLHILNYDPSNNPAHLLDPSGVVYSLWFMGNSLKAQYARKHNDQMLAKASGFYRRAIQIIEELGSTFVDSKDKLKLSENFKSILEDFLETEFMQYELDKQEVHLYRAFIVSEKNKNIILNDIWQNRLYSSSNWRKVSSSIAQLEKELILSENNLKFSAEHRNTLKRKLLHQKAQLDSIQKTLAVAATTQKNDPYFPKLHQVMHREQAGLIAYFAGEKSVFAFYVGSKTIRGFQVDRKKIDGLVYTFVSSIIEYPTQTLKAQIATDSTYIESAVGLYQALWLPLFNTVSSTPSRMFISPDGILGFLPFEAMMKHRPVERQRYRTYPFLVWEYEMSYVHTILPYLEQASPQTRSNPLRCLKFAPSFVDHTRGLAELSHNQEEVKAISKIVSGKTLRYAKARRIKNAPRFLLKLSAILSPRCAAVGAMQTQTPACARCWMPRGRIVCRRMFSTAP
jgi:tetratricopeptide (TPR) repeat protein